MIEPARTSLFSPGERLLRLGEVREKTSLGATTIWRYVQTEGFPAPIRLGPNCSRWKESEIDAWIASLPRAAYGPDRK